MVHTMKKRGYPPDKRTFTTMDYFGKTLYRAYNVLTEEDIVGLIEEINDELTNTSDNKDGYLEATNCLSTRKIKNKKCWYNFFNMVKVHLHNYAELTNNPSLKSLKVASYWAKRMYKDVTEEQYYEQMYINYGNLHAHSNLDLGLIYYLQNPSRIYGTLIENNGREFIVPGDENSLVIHHSDMNHAAVLPPPLLTKDSPRCTIIVDFKYWHKFL
jgi:hypothetical protein